MTDINVGQLSEAINDKMDRDGQNVDTASGADSVIAYQVPTAENNYMWYRLYASGWVEQGGFAILPAQAASTLATASSSLPITMLDTNYSVSWIQVSDAGNSHELTQVSVNRTITSININFYSLAATVGGNVIGWEVKGMSGSSSNNSSSGGSGGGSSGSGGGTPDPTPGDNTGATK